MDVDDKEEEDKGAAEEEEDDKQVDEFPEVDTNDEEKQEKKEEEKDPENKLDNDATIEEEGEKPQEEENAESLNKNEDQEDPNQAEDRPLGVKVTPFQIKYIYGDVLIHVLQDATGKLSDVNLEQEDENAKDEEAQASEQGQALPVPSAVCIQCSNELVTHLTLFKRLKRENSKKLCSNNRKTTTNPNPQDLMLTHTEVWVMLRRNGRRG